MTPPFARRAAILGLLVVTLIGCASGSPPSTSGSSVASSSPSPSGSASAPGQPGAASPSTDPGDIATGAPPPDDGAGGIDPNGRVVIPQPGQLDVHPIPAEVLSATVDGRRVVLTVRWTSGVEPCYVLDSVVILEGDHAFTITLREGHGPGDAMCIEIAETKQVRLDLGDLATGTYTISDGAGGAAPIRVVVG